MILRKVSRITFSWLRVTPRILLLPIGIMSMLLVEHSVICQQYSIRHSYLLTKLHIISKTKEFTYNVLSFCVYF